jgi:hypothetical protein
MHHTVLHRFYQPKRSESVYSVRCAVSSSDLRRGVRCRPANRAGCSIDRCARVVECTHVAVLTVWYSSDVLSPLLVSISRRHHKPGRGGPVPRAGSEARLSWSQLRALSVVVRTGLAAAAADFAAAAAYTHRSSDTRERGTASWKAEQHNVASPTSTSANESLHMWLPQQRANVLHIQRQVVSVCTIDCDGRLRYGGCPGAAANSNADSQRFRHGELNRRHGRENQGSAWGVTSERVTSENPHIIR